MRLKHDDLFWRQPNVRGVGIGTIRDAHGERDKVAIIVTVTEKVPQDQLPPEDRIPDRIECIAVHLEEDSRENILWGHRNLIHRPVMAGVSISGPRNPSSDETSVGILTAPATRNSDGRQVLVSNLHTLTAGYDSASTGSEEMYQPTSDNPNYKVVRISDWVPIVRGQDNIADVAILEPLSNVDAIYDLHNRNHDMGVVARGTVEPTREMVLAVLGDSPRVMTARVKRVDRVETIGGVRFTGVTVLDLSQNPGQQGDSGAPCLHYSEDDGYQMS